MVKQFVALLHPSLSDLWTSGGFATAFLTGEVLRITSPKWILVQSMILMHPKPLDRQNSHHCP